MSAEVVSRAEFEALLKEFREVQKRLASFESRMAEEPPISEETVNVIAAAIAAYIGKRATIRVIRRVNDSDQWRLQGRAALQASHAMTKTRALHR